MDERSLSDIFREVVTGFFDLLRSEIRLAKSEASHNAKQIGIRIAATVAYGIIAWLGLQAFLAFCIIGLGKMADGRYWLSSLVVSLVLLIPGVLLTIRSIKRIGQDASLPRLRDSLNHDQDVTNRKIRDISESTKKRVS